MDLSHLAARTHERSSTDCEEAEAIIKQLNTMLEIAQDALQYITEQADIGTDGPLLGTFAHDALIQISVVE